MCDINSSEPKCLKKNLWLVEMKLGPPHSLRQRVCGCVCSRWCEWAGSGGMSGRQRACLLSTGSRGDEQTKWPDLPLAPGLREREREEEKRQKKFKFGKFGLKHVLQFDKNVEPNYWQNRQF